MLKKARILSFFKQLWPLLVLILATFLLAEIQIANHHLIIDIDTIFHYNRFYDTAEQLKTGHFSYFQSNFAFGHSGRIVNALYGPFFAYFNGFLLLICGSWYNYQLLSYFLLCLTAGSGMYLLTRKVKTDKVVSILIAVLYINIGSIQAWFDHTNFIAWGGAIAPFIFIEAVNMLQNKSRPIRWQRLMLLMSLLIQIHVLSTLILALSLVPFVITSFIWTSNKRELLFNLVKAVSGTILLTANVWGAILVVLSGNDLVVTTPHSLSNTALEIAESGSLRGTIMAGLAFLFIAQILFAIINIKRNYLNAFVSIEGGIFFLLASKLFPWLILQKKLPYLSNYLQFPHRLTIVAYPLLLLGIAISITDFKTKNNWKKIAIYILSFIILENYGTNYSRITEHSTLNLSQVYQLKNGHQIQGNFSNYSATGIKSIGHNKAYIITATRGRYYRNTIDMKAIKAASHNSNQQRLLNLIIKVTPDYLPHYYGENTAQATNKIYIDRVLKPETSGKFSYQVQNNGNLKIKWYAQKRNGNLPIIIYHNSVLHINGQTIKPHLSTIGTPIFKQRIGKNSAILRYIIPKWFNLILIISIFSWFLLISKSIFRIYNYLRRLVIR